MEEIHGFVTLFDNCCHGGTRKKATAWWATVYCFLQLVHDVMFHSSMKDGNPELINGQVVARLEAACPILLCERLAQSQKSKPWSWVHFRSNTGRADTACTIFTA